MATTYGEVILSAGVLAGGAASIDWVCYIQWSTPR
jgi:hypothetical protein